MHTYELVCPHTKGYAAHLTCLKCITDESNMYSSHNLPTHDNWSHQPYMVKHLSILAVIEGLDVAAKTETRSSRKRKAYINLHAQEKLFCRGGHLYDTW